EPAVQVRAPLLVERQPAEMPVNDQPPAADAIGPAAGDGAEMRRVVDVVVEAVEAEHQRMVDPGQTHVTDDRAESDHSYRQIAGRERDLRDNRPARAA